MEEERLMTGEDAPRVENSIRRGKPIASEGEGRGERGRWMGGGVETGGGENNESGSLMEQKTQGLV